MAPFSLAVLTAPLPAAPTPAPEVEVPAPEPEAMESEADILRRDWVGIRVMLDGLGRSIPDDSDELLEDKEIWMRRWNELITRMQAAGVSGQHLQVDLEFEGDEEALLLEGRQWYTKFEGPIRALKEAAAAQAEVATARPPAAQQKAAVLAPSKGKNMGAPLPTGRMTGVHPLQIVCERCESAGKKCDGRPGVRCDACAKSHKGCSFKIGPTRAIPKRRAQKAAPASSRAPTAESAPRTASSRQEVMELDSEGDAVESEEVSAPEAGPVAGPSTLPARPTQAIGPLPSRPKKRRAEETLDRYEEGGELERLRSENARLRELLRRAGERARSQQAEMAAQSSRLYSLSREWKEDEELAEFL
ncbi:hypothetical protein DEU56DRAFT_918883 [Suillus clintonianus]|uniref:uncharacterized protein n=1 Tax=Suillus clintonianus TaxID=1904413 RepID=UPI001B86E950|nr:uncharacterized protein DEU56DRAFT_918883 [Suillus clintonianus]KAG2118412.1 hypothetical protein DEU56DRAFT_918883 [Suillus clintonianus]